MTPVIIFLFCTFLYTNALPNLCCENNEPLIKFHCTNNSALWINSQCEFEAYIVVGNEFSINNDDSLTLTPDNEIIAQNRYCVGSVDNEKIAMICFENPAEVVPTGQMSHLAILICCSISIISLILTLAVYLFIPSLRDMQGKCMMFTIFCLLMSFIFLAVVQSPTTEASCRTLGFLIYFWFISTFFWLNIVSFNVWRSVLKPKLLSSKKYIFYFYNIYGWGGPILLLIILLICHHTEGSHIQPKMGVEKCWFSDSIAIRAYFYGPILALLIINIIMFVSTAWKLTKQTKNIAEQKFRSHKFKFCLYLKLFLTMGICWVFEPISELLRVEGSYIWIVTDYINALQGLIIFLLLVVFRKRVRRELAKSRGMCCGRLPKEWATMPDEQCEELEEEVDELTSHDENPGNNTQINL